MNLCRLPGRFGIFRLPPQAEPPAPVWRSRFLSLTRTAEELSIVCEQHLLPDVAPASGPWSCFQVEGPLAFSLTGVLASLTEPLARADVSVFAVSTYDTDYLLIRTPQAGRAAQLWRAAGHAVHGGPPPDDDA